MAAHGDGWADGAANLLAAPAVRNASLACLAAAGLFLSVRALNQNNRSLANARDEEEHKTKKATREGRPHSSEADPMSSSALAEEEASRSIARTNGMSSGATPPWRRSMRRSSSSYVEHDGHGRSPSGYSSSNSSKNAVAIFWDVDNCQPHSGASGHEVAQAIRRAAQSAGPDPGKIGTITSFKAYLELSAEGATPNAAQVQLRSELQGSGVSLIDTPKSGRKDVADKMMIADLLSYAIDRRPPALIVLLSGDRDFAYPLGLLRNRGYEILLITPPVGASAILEASATYKLRWRQDVLGLTHDASGRAYDGNKAIATAPAATAAATTTAVTNGSLNGATETAAAKKANDSPLRFLPASLKPQDMTKETPEVFKPLITVLEMFQQEGNPRPLRTQANVRMRSMDPQVFARAQASGWSEYVAIAEAAGIVSLGAGAQLGCDWIALRKSSSSNANPPRVAPPTQSTNADTTAFRPSTAAPTAAVPAARSTPMEPSTSSGSYTAPVSSTSKTPADPMARIYYPMIEAYKMLKADLPANQHPTAKAMHTLLDDIAADESLNFNPYRYGRSGYDATPTLFKRTQSFDLLIKMAFKAKVARLSPNIDNLPGPVVEMASRYANMDTGLTLPLPPSYRGRFSNNESTTTSWRRPTQAASDSDDGSDPAYDSPIESKDREPWQNVGYKMVAGMDLAKVPSFAHKPSGEEVKAIFFPLANHLLHRRHAGQNTSPENMVHMTVSRHHKIGQALRDWNAFQEYIQCAEQEDIIQIEGNGDTEYRAIRLSPRLCKGEHEMRDMMIFKKGDSNRAKQQQEEEEISYKMRPTYSTDRAAAVALATTAVSPRRDSATLAAPLSSAASSQQPTFTSTDAEGVTLSSSTSASSITTAEQRAKFKPLVDVLVSLRNQGKELSRQPNVPAQAVLLDSIEPARVKVASSLLSSTSRTNNVDDQATTVSPAVWLQEHGFTSFTDMFRTAEQGGFVQLLERGGVQRVRLGERYEKMFFADDQTTLDG